MEAIKPFSPVNVTPERKIELQNIMASSNSIFQMAALEVYENSDPQYVKRLRNQFKTGELTLAYNPRAKKAFHEMSLIEAEVIASFIKVSTALCNSFYYGWRSKTQLEIDDYITEASFAVYDAMYTYKGTNDFSTYLYGCVKNRLIEYVRKEVNQVNAKEKVDYDEKQLSQIPEEVQAPNTFIITDAIGKAGLSDDEKEVIRWALTGDDDWRKKMAASKVHADTKKPYSKAWVSSVYLAAVDKLQKVMKQAA